MLNKVTTVSVGMPKDMFRSRDEFGKKLTKPALQDGVMHWHKKFLPRHFRSGAAEKYGYDKRKKKTLQRKRRLAERGNADARLPLVMTGRTRNKTRRMIQVSGTNKRARGRMQAPYYMTDQLINEITAVTQQEVDKTAKVVGESMRSRMYASRTRTVKRVG